MDRNLPTQGWRKRGPSFPLALDEPSPSHLMSVPTVTKKTHRTMSKASRRQASIMKILKLLFWLFLQACLGAPLALRQGLS